jgi:hypothetical protein
MRKCLFTLCLISLFTRAGAQDSSDLSAKIKPELLRQDFLVFRDSLRAEHPGLYRYQTKHQFDRLYDSCYRQLNQGKTLLDLYAIIKLMISSIEDGHTSCDLPAPVKEQAGKQMKLFPVAMRFIGNHAFVRCTFSKELPAGTEVLRIDGTPVSLIRGRLFKYMSSDGSTRTHKYEELNGNGFAFLYALIFHERTDHEVTYATKGGKPKSVRVEATNFTKYPCDSVTVPRKYLELERFSNRVALLTVRTFSEYRCQKIGKNFHAFLDSSFRAINDGKVTSLVIDLRNNGGGEDEYGAMLYHYLSDRPFRYYASLRTTKRQLKKEEDPDLRTVPPAEHPYLGKVLFLINGNSFSSTAEFSAVARSNRRGLFIGEETGGGYYGNTSGTLTTLTLPNTKIEIAVPRLKYVMAVRPAKYTDRGIIPDITVSPSISDILTNRDAVREKALTLAGPSR